MEKTIRELADELGVSKQTIQYHLRSLPTSTWQKNDKRIILIKPSGQKELKKKIVSKRPTNMRQTTDKYTTKENNPMTVQLNVKDEQIKELLEQNKNLQKLLENQQVLTLKAQERVQLLENKNEDQNKEITEQDPKKKWQFWK